MDERVRVGILGCGHVGGALVRLIHDHADVIEARAAWPNHISWCAIFLKAYAIVATGERAHSMEDIRGFIEGGLVDIVGIVALGALGIDVAGGAGAGRRPPHAGTAPVAQRPGRLA